MYQNTQQTETQQTETQQTETQQTETQQTETQQTETQQRQSRMDCYSKSHLFGYVDRFGLEFNLFTPALFKRIFSNVLTRLLHGGVSSDEKKYVRFEHKEREKQTPIVLTKIIKVSEVVDKDNNNFVHNFIEFHYYKDKIYTNLVDIITTTEYQQQFTQNIRNYNRYLSKGLHYIVTEIEQFRK